MVEYMTFNHTMRVRFSPRAPTYKRASYNGNTSLLHREDDGSIPSGRTKTRKRVNMVDLKDIYEELSNKIKNMSEEELLEEIRKAKEIIGKE